MRLRLQHAAVLLSAGLAACLLLQACTSTPSPSSISAINALTTSEASLATGKVTPIDRFSPNDTIYFYASLTWSDDVLSKDYRTIEWRWIKDDGKVMLERSSRYLIKSKPFDVRARADASTLGTGRFTVEARIADQLVTQAHFVIEP